MMEESKQAEAAREPVKQPTVSTPLIDESSLHGKVKHITWLERIRRFESLPLRLIGLCTGIAVIVIAIMTLSAKILMLNVLGAINQAWIIIFGLLLVGLEIRGWNNLISRHASRWLDYNVHILTTLYGRGVLYIFLGTLELGFWSSLLHLILGIVLCAMGVIIIAVGIALSVKLWSLRKELSKQDVSRQVFRQYDINGDGKLSTTELAALCQALGSKLSHAELEAAVLLLDRNRDGFVDEEEFISFWQGKRATNVLQNV